MVDYLFYNIGIKKTTLISASNSPDLKEGNKIAYNCKVISDVLRSPNIRYADIK